MKLPTFIRSEHGAEYDEEFMHVMTSVYERMTPHTKMRMENVKPSSTRIRATACSTSAAPPAR